MDIFLLVNLTSRAWSLPILASLDAGVPGRQAALLHATGASRGAFAQSLTHLLDLGLLARRAGHGHPLRPEFELTPEGAALAPLARRIVELGQGAALLRRSWSLPILGLTAEPTYFGVLRQALAPITDRALSESLKRLEAAAWLRREVHEASRPPRPVYQATGTGAKIAGVLAPQIVWS